MSPHSQTPSHHPMEDEGCFCPKAGAGRGQHGHHGQLTLRTASGKLRLKNLTTSLTLRLDLVRTVIM